MAAALLGTLPVVVVLVVVVLGVAVLAAAMLEEDVVAPFLE